MRTAEIGAALDRLVADVKAQAVDLVRQYRSVDAPPIVRAVYEISLLKQAVDTPHRARAQIAAWIAEHNARNGAGAAQTFLAQCLAAAGSAKTLATIDAEIVAMESQAQVVVGRVANDGWTWQQVAVAIESAMASPPESDFTYTRLPIPSGYTTVWGEPW